MVFAAANFTGVMVSVNAVAVNGSSYMDPEVAAALTPEEKEHAVFGSIMTFVLEIFTLTCIWTIKACLLILYYRLTASLRKQQIAVLCIGGYCVVGYILVVALLVGYWCAPTYEYWAVPYNNSQCATYYNHMIFATAWNISSDLMLLAIPFPIVFKTQLPLKRKIGLCCVLGLGALNASHHPPRDALHSPLILSSPRRSVPLPLHHVVLTDDPPRCRSSSPFSIATSTSTTPTT